MDPLAPWTVKESVYCALRSARAVSSACTISLSWWSTAMVSSGTVGWTSAFASMSGWTKAWFFNATAKPVMVVGCCFGGGCWDQLWPARLKGKAGILLRILEREARVSGYVWLHVMVLQHCHCQEYWYGRPEGRAMSSSVLVMEFSNLSCIFSIQCFHHLIVLCCCWILHRAYSHIVGSTPRLGHSESLPDQSAARKTSVPRSDSLDALCEPKSVCCLTAELGKNSFQDEVINKNITSAVRALE